MLLTELEQRALIRPPAWLTTNTVYLVLTGSHAYGVAEDESDLDLYGVCVPPKETVFPHLRGEILGFGRQILRFEQWQQHHIIDPSARGGRGQEYDFSIYNIVRYFHLCMENNPNMIDSLFVPAHCIRHMNTVGRMIRDNRRLFLHKGSWHKCKGYAFSQMAKIRDGHNAQGSRKELIDKYGYDTKFATHTVRLLNQAELILTEGDLDLGRNVEQLRAIRRGEWPLERIEAYFTTKERELESLYTTSTLQHSPDEGAIKALLISCLEQHYGSLKEIPSLDLSTSTLYEIDRLLQTWRNTQDTQE